MTPTIAFVLHLLVLTAGGASLLHRLGTRGQGAVFLAEALLAGMVMEFAVSGSFLLLGLAWAPLSLILGLVFLAVFLYDLRGKDFMRRFSLAGGGLPLVILLLFMADKVLYAGWMIYEMPVLADDALTHWAGRARWILGGENFSLDSTSEAYLGLTGKPNPPGLVLFRALTAEMAGGWDGVFSRLDSLLFFILSPFLMYDALRRLKTGEWVALAFTLALVCNPLQNVHSWAGIADIAVQCFVCAMLGAFLRGDIRPAFLFAVGAALVKNEGLVIWLPGLLLCLVLFPGERGRKSIFKAAALSLFFLLPWLVFKLLAGLQVTTVSVDGGILWHGDAPTLFIASYWSPENAITLIPAILICVFTLRKGLFDRKARALLGMLVFSQLALMLVFTLTPAYVFLKNEMTIHRTLLQCYPLFLFTATVLFSHTQESQSK